MNTSKLIIGVGSATLGSLILVGYFLSVQPALSQQSVELGVAERSVGNGLGLAVPASGSGWTETCTVTAVPATVVAGGNVQIDSTATDPVYMNISSVAIQQPSWSNFQSLAASESQNWAVPQTVPDGNYRVRTQYSYTLTNGTNHTHNIVCTAALYIQNAELIPNPITPTKVTWGENVLFSATVDNTGSLDTPAFDSLIEIDGDNNGSWETSIPTNRTTVTGGSSRDIYSSSITWTAPSSNSTARGRVSVDINNEVPESDDTNNTAGPTTINVYRPGVDADPINANGAAAGYWGPFNQGVPAAFEFQLNNETANNTDIRQPFENELQIDFQTSGAGACANNVAIDDPCIDLRLNAGTVGLLPAAGMRVYPAWTPTQQGTLRARYIADADDDLNEADETDNDTSWHSFTVGDPAPIINFEVNINNTGWQTGSYFRINDGDPISLRWSTTYADSCNAIAGSGFATGGATSGTDPVTSPALGSTDTFTIRCDNSFGNFTQDSIQIENSTGPSIGASDTNVEIGDTVDIDWDTGGSLPADCSIVGPNLNMSPLATVTGTQTVTIDAQSTFTIDCGAGGTDSVTVTASGIIFES